jgi:SP family general alpha glucoside:H+ symporter-like MFS transporter
VPGTYFINANFQTALQNVGLPGESCLVGLCTTLTCAGGFLGLFLCGWGQERFGSRKTYMVGMLFAICCVFLYVFAVNIGMLLAAQAVSACAWGVFNTLTAAYAVELCPVQLRGYSAGFISFCWGAGSFIASGINRAALDVEGDWGWRECLCAVLPLPRLPRTVH